jgi:hypothetical protein
MKAILKSFLLVAFLIALPVQAQFDFGGPQNYGIKAITYSSSMTPDARAGMTQRIVVTDATAFTINAPSRPTAGQTLVISISNDSGGAMGEVTWNSIYKFNSIFLSPPNGRTRAVAFSYDGTNWNEIGKRPDVISVKEYGAAGDTREVTDAVTTATSATISSANADFVAADIGKTLSVENAGTAQPSTGSNKTLIGIITAVAGDGESCTIDTTATASVLNKRMRIGTNDTLSFQNAATALQAEGGGSILIPPGRYLVGLNSNNNGTPVYWPNALMSFSGLQGVRIVFDGATLVTSDDFTFNTNGWGFFKFVSCQNVAIENPILEGVSQWVSSPSAIQPTYRRGTSGFIVQTNVRGFIVNNGRLTGMGYGLYSGNYADDAVGGSDNFNVSLYTNDVGYPVATYKSGHNSFFRINAEKCHRAIYLAGSKNVDGKIRVKEWDAPVAVLVTGGIQNGSIASTSATEDFSSNVNLDVTYVPNTYIAFGGTNTYLTGLSPSSDLGAGSGGNIVFKIDAVMESDSTPNLTAFLQTSQGLTPGSCNINLSIDNVLVTGRWDRSAVAAANAGYITYILGNGGGTDGVQLRNMRIEDLVVKDNPSDPPANGLRITNYGIKTNVYIRRVTGITAASALGNPADTSMRYVFDDCSITPAPSGTYVATRNIGTPAAATADLKDVLVAKNYITDGGASPLNLDGGAFTTTGTANLNLAIASGSFRATSATNYTGLFQGGISRTAPTGSTTMTIDALAGDGTSSSQIYFFSQTTGAGATRVDFYDSTSTVNHRLNLRGGGASYLNANSGNLGLFGTGSFGTGDKVLFIGDRAAAPVSNPTGGSILYSESGGLKYRGTGGIKLLPGQAYVAATYGATVTLDARAADFQRIAVTNGTAFAIAAPSNPLAGQTIDLEILNSSGGAMGAITWDAVFKMETFTAPSNGTRKTLRFRYDGTNWIQIGPASGEFSMIDIGALDLAGYSERQAA